MDRTTRQVIQAIKLFQFKYGAGMKEQYEDALVRYLLRWNLTVEQCRLVEQAKTTDWHELWCLSGLNNLEEGI